MAQRALWSVLRDGPTSPYARVVRRRLVGGPRRAADAGARRSGSARCSRPASSRSTRTAGRPATSRCCATSTTSSRCGRAPRSCRWPSWSTSSGTGWRTGGSADQELNYRRFFDVDTLAALRSEDPDVFDADPRGCCSTWCATASVDGLRIDHPDGLADPRGLPRAGWPRRTDGAWVVVEKILEPDEALPDDWSCAGTTGYDALRLVNGVFHRPGRRAGPSTALADEVAGEREDWPTAVEARQARGHRGRLSTPRSTGSSTCSWRSAAPTRRCATTPGATCSDCVVELLVAFDRYRAYVVPGEPAPAESRRGASTRRPSAPGRACPRTGCDALDLVRDLVLGPRRRRPARRRRGAARAELVIRFQQTCGPVMAKGVEDTAFYRWVRLVVAQRGRRRPRPVSACRRRSCTRSPPSAAAASGRR